MKKIFLLLILLTTNVSIIAATKTWQGGTGSGFNWTTGSNWGGTAPLAGDDIVFNTAGVITFSTMPASVSYYSLTISQGTVTLAAGSNMALTLGGNVGTDFTISSGASFILGTNVSIILSASATANISGTMTINPGRTFTAGGAGASVSISGILTNNGTFNASNTTAVTTVTGTFINSGTISNSTTARLIFGSGGTYQHSQNGGAIPTALWNANSTCKITGITLNAPTGLVQVYGNLTWNCPNQTILVNFTASLTTINGNLTVESTGISGTFSIAQTSSAGPLNIAKDFIINGGTVRTTTTGTRTINVNGNFLMSGGTLNMSSSTGVTTIYVKGNFTHTGGTITRAGTSVNSIVFNGTGTQNYTSGGLVTGPINFNVNSGSTLQMAATGTVVSGGGTFTLYSGATLGITSNEGITTVGTASGNIQTTGGRSYSTGSNYIYNGTSAQSIGTGFPTGLTGILTINNPGNTVILNSGNAKTIANGGSINLIAGTFAAGTNLLTMASTSSITRSGGSMTGSLQGNGIYNVTYTGNDKTTGAELSGSGLNNVTINLNAGQSLTFDVSRSVVGALTMTNGNIITGANTLTLGTGISVRGTLSYISGTIIGNFRRWFTNATSSNILFPIGTASNYRPANISFTSAPTMGGTLTVFFTPSNPGSNGLPLTDGGTQIIKAGIEGFWTINATTLAGGTYSLDLTADGFTGASVVSTLRLLKRPAGGGNWIAQGTHSAGTGTTSTPIVHRTGMSGFSEFGVGGASDNPLPVELSSFSATTIGSSVKLNWVTATEVNNYGFEVERQAHTSTPLSVTGWEKIGFVNGNGNSNSPKSYSFVDDKVTAGKYSYRLKQIDNDGQFEYSKTIEVDFGVPTKFELSQNYPNPFNPTTTIKFSLPDAGNVKLSVYNILGQEVRTLMNENKESGVHTINFDASELNSGMYIYKIEAGTFVQTRKMTLVK